MTNNASFSKYGQTSLLQKVFTKTNLAIAAITIGTFIAVLVLGNIIKL